MIATLQPKTQLIDTAVNHFPRFAADEQLALLWKIYQGSRDPASGTPLPDFARLLCDRLLQQPADRQARILRDLVTNTDTSFSREYGALDRNDKLAFWFAIFHKNRGDRLSVEFQNYRLSPPAQEFWQTFNALDPIPQTQLLDRIVNTLGVNPIAGTTLIATG